jgi:subtilisin family serine protease
MIKRRRRTALCVLAAAAVATTFSLTSAPWARADTQISFPVQAMGDLQVSPGATLEAGYAFQTSGGHPAARVVFSRAVVSFSAGCASGPGGGVITVHLGWDSYVEPANDGGQWWPTADQFSLAGYQGSAVVPDLCGGGLVSLHNGASFTASLRSSDAVDPVQVRWHYAIAGPAGGQGGQWSGTQHFTPGPGGPPAPPPTPQPTQIIVKVNLAGGYTIGDVTANYPVTVDKGGLASRGIYLVSPTLAQNQWPPDELQQLANQINGDHNVVDYAEENLPVRLADTEFYAWPYGPPTPDGTLPRTFVRQPAAAALQLATAHQQSQGAGVTVAVLDTGADPVPALRGRLLKGWNYLADNTDTRDVTSPAGSAAVGHGTFVAGLIALVAPKAKILPERVLNGNGYGTVYGAAQAILDATAAGAGVINLSFGTENQPPSNLLQQAIQQAQQAGVIVVAAAGNTGSNQQEYPAAWSQALSVAAMDQADSSLTNFSNWGGWVQVGAPGEQVVGPMPGGGYDTWAGTSMSTPFVSGQAALIRSLVPGIHADHVFQAIENTATQLPQNPIHSGAINIVSSLAFAIAHP